MRQRTTLKLNKPLLISPRDWLHYLCGIYYITRRTNIHFGDYVTIIFAAGHELFHRKETIHKIAGVSALYKMLYAHFFIEHIFGHHRSVALMKDPATSRKDEYLQSFLVRSVRDGFVSAWKIENKRLLKVHGKTKAVFFHNRVFLFLLGYVSLLTLGYFISGWYGICYQIAQASIAVIILETANYVEHYGLQRKEVSPGKYENVTVRHSWNAPQKLSTYLLFKLQRHSDHHANSFKPYQSLCSYEDSPMLPHGYTISSLVATFPPVWFKMMNPLVECAERNELPDKETVKKTNRLAIETLLVFCFIYTFVLFLTIKH